jgi:hypothetical protein
VVGVHFRDAGGVDRESGFGSTRDGPVQAWRVAKLGEDVGDHLTVYEDPATAVLAEGPSGRRHLLTRVFRKSGPKGAK